MKETHKKSEYLLRSKDGLQTLRFFAATAEEAKEQANLLEPNAFKREEMALFVRLEGQ